MRWPRRGSASRRARYARPEGLGQAFNFDLLEADFAADQFRTIITDNLTLAAESGSSSTWVLSNHDVMRHASRYGLPRRDGAAERPSTRWLRTGGTKPRMDRDAGLRRARAATMLMLALPGSAYLYQGEELGLPEVVEIHPDQRQDPTFHRSPGVDVGVTDAGYPYRGGATGRPSASAPVHPTYHNRATSTTTPSTLRTATRTRP